MPYHNFTAAVYITARGLDRVFDLDKFTKDFANFEHHINVSKVYLETYRGNLLVSREKIQRLKSFFTQKGIQTAGGITATIDRGPSPFHTLCYNNPEHRQRLTEAIELTAELFDELILDDFYFTICKCPACIAAKGERSWEESRIQTLRQAAEELVLGPAKRANPNCKVVMKFPNWYESFQSAGYDLEELPGRFDGIYTGTENRDPRYTQQDIPRYLSYALPIYFERIAPGKNGGGWFDLFDSYNNLNYYVEQAHLTLLSKVPEVTLFCFELMKETIYTPLAGFALEQTDRILGELGNPIGTPCYKPFHSSGEDFLPEYLGMAGVPVLITPEFPGNETVLLTADAAYDPEILDKLKDHLTAGNTAVITSGFVKALSERGIQELALWRVSDRKMAVKEFATEIFFCGFRHIDKGIDPIILPVVEYGTNDSWPVVVGVEGCQNAPVLLLTTYGLGKLILLTIPDNFSDLYRLPAKVLTAIRRALSDKFDITLESEAPIGLFIYDNQTFVVESFLPNHTDVQLHIAKPHVKLKDLAIGGEIQGTPASDGVHFTLSLFPSVFRAFKMI